MHSNTTQANDRPDYAIALAEAIAAALHQEAEHAAIVVVPGHTAETSPWLLTHHPDGGPLRRWQLSRRTAGRWADVLTFGGSLDAAGAFMAAYDAQVPVQAAPRAPLAIAA